MPSVVMMAFCRLVKKSRMKFVYLGGILIRSMAFFRICKSTLSYAFERSCNRIQSGLRWVFASSMIRFIILIGVSVAPPGSPAKLLPFNILCLTITCDNLLVITFMTIFLSVSNKVIGLVLVMSLFHSIG